MIQYIISSIDQACDEILNLVQQVYGRNDIDIENDIANIIEMLKEDIYFFIEYPYVDKVYRDTYYTYFSSKHNEYPRDCIRVSLFDTVIEEKYFRQTKFKPVLENSFLGFFIIRPTFPHVIGRTVISRKAYLEDNFLICDYKAQVLVNGIKLSVEGFPFSSQDKESISCAETTIWALMEYFGNRYADYRPANPSAIINSLNKYSKKRLLPSNGLTVDQISYALKEFGFGTLIYAREAAYEDELDNIIATYVESGIPVIASIENDPIGHAILIIGHEVDENINFAAAPKKTLIHATMTKKYIDYGDIPRLFIFNDDNLVPYTKTTLGNPVVHYHNPEWLGSVITSIIVPLYSRIYLDVVKAKSLVLQILVDEDFGFIFNNGFILRFFLASSRSFKAHIAGLDELNEEVKNALVLSKMPKFIWCAEVYLKNDFVNNIAKGLVVIDATEANEVWMNSLIFAGYPDKCFVNFGRKLVTINKRLHLYSKFSTNLK